MLRNVINKHIKPRIVPFQLTTTASGATVDIGYSDYTVTRSGTGAGTLTHRDGFYRNGLIFLSQYTTSGGYATYNSSTPDNDVFPFSILSQAGAGNEGIVDGFTFGWDSPDLSLTLKQSVKSTQVAPRVIWGKITGSTGTVSINTRDFGCTRVSTGVYDITFKTAFGKIPTVKVSAISTSGVCAETLSLKTSAGVRVSLATAAQTATDYDFYILAIGSDSRSDGGKGRMPLENTQRKPRIVAAQVTMTGGVPSITIGGATGGADFGTLVDNGAGDFSLTITEPFKREPAIFVTTTTQRAQVHSYAANVIRILTKNAGGTNTDVNGVTNIFVIGSDDAASY